MRRQVFMACFAVAAILAIEAIGAAQARAAGYYNMPGNFCQWWGHGFGAGYHAPLILGPPTCRGWCAGNETRLLYAPAPCCSCCQCGMFDGPSAVRGQVFTGRSPASTTPIVGSNVPLTKAVPTGLAPMLPNSTVPAVDIQPTIAAPVGQTSEASTVEAPAPAVVPSTDVEPEQAPLRPLFDPPPVQQ
jgi:hypothetical protein